jgi:RNA polymerase sigma-54 factor
VRAIRRPDGGWEVEPWAPHLPQIVVREARFARLAARCRTAEELAYLRDRMTAARRYAELLERRRRTVLEVAGEIVKRQARFLDDGAPALRPLSMRTIADALRLHESTVSRTVANKALLAPRGTLPLRAFFAAPARVGDTTGPTHAQLVARIADMIAGEGREGVVLSDATIAQRLQAMGVPIARRTVAKHRGQLGLPTPARRRRELRA